MTSLSKRKKGSKILNVPRSDDRITSLPSSLITKILSCLPTKDAVATSVLSTSWKRSWTTVTNLDFKDNFNSKSHTTTFQKFTAFVTRVLLLRERSCLQRVRMKCYNKYDDSLVNAWLTAMLQCNVQELDISIYLKHQGQLPSDIFLCSTFVVLKLDVRGYVNMPISACLPCLRTLHLTRVELVDDFSFTSLCFPMLEELKLCDCVDEDVGVVYIDIRTLKNLIIEHLTYDTDKKYQIVINTPALEYFKFGDYGEAVQVVNMDHLIKAEINFDYEGDYTEAIGDFLTGISKVESLVLSGDSTQIIDSCNLELPKFSNLNYLKLHTSNGPGWTVLTQLLENSLCLETLYIQQGEANNIVKEDGPGTSLFHDVPPCFLSHLKEIEIGQFQYYACEDELELVEYILKNARVLEKLTLHYIDNIGAENDAEFFKALLSLPRVSPTCKVVVV